MQALIERSPSSRNRADGGPSTISDEGAELLQRLPVSAGNHRARMQPRDTIQHSPWLFGNEERSRMGEATFNRLRAMLDAPATSVSVDVCEVAGQV